MATSAPSRASRRAVARPIPREPPVTRATRFANASDISRSLEKTKFVYSLGSPYLEPSPASQIKSPIRPPTSTQAARKPPQSNQVIRGISRPKLLKPR